MAWGRRDLGALGLLWAAVLVAHGGVISGAETFVYEDFLYWFAPTRSLVDAAWADGRLPLWDPWVGVGGPLVFNSAAAPLYPLDPLATWVFGGGVPGLLRFIVLHLGLAGTFLYLLARDRGCRPAVALAAGLSFAFCGPLLSYAQENPYHVFSLTWTPLGLLCFLRALESRRLAPLAGAGACMALMLYGGEPQVWYFFVFTLAAAALAHAWGESSRGRALGRAGALLAAVVVLAVLLSAAQSMATMAGLAGSSRGQGEPLDVRLAFSVHPLRLVSLLVPGFTGVPFPENTLWANGLTQHYRTWVMSLFAGAWALLFLPAALRRGAPRALAMAMAGAALFFLVMGLGRFAPLYPLLDAVLPGLQMFRYPEKWAVAAVLPLLLAGALGLERALARPPRWFVPGLAAGALGFAVAGGAGLFEPLVRGTALYPAPALVEGAVAAIARGGLHLALVGLAATVLLAATARGRLGLPAAAWGLALVGALETPLANLPLVVTAPVEVAVEPGPMVAAMQALDPHARYRRVPDEARLPVHAGSEGYVLSQARARATGALHSLIGLARQVHIHGPAISQREGALLHEALDGASPLDGGALLATRFYVVADQAPPDWVAAAVQAGRLVERGAFPGLRAGLFEDTRALPRARRVTQAVEAPATPEALRAKISESFDFRRAAVLAPGASGGPAALTGPATETEPVELEEDAPERLALRTSGPTPGLLVLTDSFTPGWRAFVDDVETPILQADFVGRAVAVPAGASTVRFTYEHPRLGAGLAVSGGTAAALVLLLLAAAWRRHRRARPGSE